MKGFHWLGWNSEATVFFAVISQDLLFFFPQLHLSNIEEVLVYFCLLLESEHAAGSDSHPDQTSMCSSWGLQSDQTNMRKYFGTSICVSHNCLMRSVKTAESLMLHLITIKPTGWDGQTSSPRYLNIDIFLCPLGTLGIFDKMCHSDVFAFAKKSNLQIIPK